MPAADASDDAASHMEMSVDSDDDDFDDGEGNDGDDRNAADGEIIAMPADMHQDDALADADGNVAVVDVEPADRRAAPASIGRLTVNELIALDPPDLTQGHRRMYGQAVEEQQERPLLSQCRTAILSF